MWPEGENFMKPIQIVTVYAALLGGVIIMNAQRSGDDEQAVRKVLHDVFEAQNVRDLKAFGQFFALDAEFVNVTATYAKGRDEIVRMHDRAMNVVFKDVDFKSLLATTPEPVYAVRFLRPDVAIVHYQVDPAECPPCAAASAAMHGPKPGKGSRQVMSWVLSKHGGQWLIDSVQNTVWIVPATAVGDTTAPGKR
jgi:uncharacterized protein (TIGR02246 family)